MEKKTIAGYRIEGSLGEGGMGVVYRAVDPTLDRPLAVKVIRSAHMSAAAKERFLREARAASRLNHPNIVTVYAAGEEDGHPYLAMEYVEGRSLRSIIDEGPVPWEKATAWTCDILDALHRLHGEGIVHRDLKPENIMVTNEGVVKLMDFGIAHIARSETLTLEGATVGTVYYMSPEQAAGKKVDPRSDVFSMGAVLHQMLTGEYPFAGEHPMAVMYSITNLPAWPIAECGIKAPAELQGILDQAMTKNRDERYADAAAFRDALVDLRRRELGPGVGAVAKGARTRILLVGIPLAVVIVIAAVVVTQMRQRAALAPNRTVAQQYNERAQEAEGRGEIGTARDLYRKAIIADTSYALAWNNLGSLALGERDSAEAERCFRRAAAADPSSPEGLYNLASLRSDRGDSVSAEEFYRASLRANPGYVPSYNNLGRLLLETGRAAEAADVLDRALALDPQEPYAVFIPYLLKNRGLAAQQLGEDDAALEFWTRGAARDSSNAELRRLIAEWHERHSRHTEP
jgi:tetratricopeptide (TPR) repeat protein/predicted Ser/Thr protein kinase